MAKKKTVKLGNAQKAVTEPAKSGSKEVAYDFIKSNFFRVVKVDGAFGGIGPNGQIHMSIYNERQPIPTKVVHQVVEGGVLGPEIPEKRESRRAFIREVEADLVFDVNQAIALRDWLDSKIAQYRAMEEKQSAKKTGGVH